MKEMKALAKEMIWAKTFPDTGTTWSKGSKGSVTERLEGQQRSVWLERREEVPEEVVRKGRKYHVCVGEEVPPEKVPPLLVPPHC